MREHAAGWLAAIPDLQFKIEQILSEVAQRARKLVLDFLGRKRPKFVMQVLARLAVLATSK
jgi:hypothetical protein